MAQKNAVQVETRQVETLEHPAGTGHGGSFPPFQKDTFASQLIWLVITFVALYLLMSRIALPRVGAILEARRQQIDGDLAQAEKLKAESDQAIAVYEKALADARGRAQTLANESREKMLAEAETARKALDATLNAKIAAAEKVIAERRVAAMRNVQGIAAEAATAIVERLVGIVPAKADVQSAVADVLKR
jgi:F-type H+-transporting ATPase subunit b